MTARGRVAIAGILLSALAVIGCVTVIEPPKSGFTDAEVDRMTQRRVDQNWNYVGVTDELQPDVGPVILLPSKDLAPMYALCMNEAGYDQYSVSPSGGYGILDHIVDEEEIATQYVCEARYQVDPRESALNEKQLNYLYDYYETMLEPCLARAGFTEFEQFSSRTDMDGEYPWNPYYGLPQEIFVKLTSKSQLVRMCPAAPVDSGFTMYWPGDY